MHRTREEGKRLELKRWWRKVGQPGLSTLVLNLDHDFLPFRILQLWGVIPKCIILYIGVVWKTIRDSCLKQSFIPMICMLSDKFGKTWRGPKLSSKQTDPLLCRHIPNDGLNRALPVPHTACLLLTRPQTDSLKPIPDKGNIWVLWSREYIKMHQWFYFSLHRG